MRGLTFIIVGGVSGGRDVKITVRDRPILRQERAAKPDVMQCGGSMLEIKQM
jgi:hypothetical protein